MSLEQTIKRLLLDDPMGWRFGEHTADHARTELSLWIANGAMFLDTTPAKGGIRFWCRSGLWRAYRKSRQLQLAAKMEGSR